MTGIQLIFEDGTESPMLGGAANNGIIQTVEIPNKPVKTVTAFNDNGYVSNMMFVQGGNEITVFNRGKATAGLPRYSRDIPPNNQIVGVYGVKNDSWIL